MRRTPDTGTTMHLQTKRRTGRPPSETSYEYICPSGHKRTERERIGGQLPICTTCHMNSGTIQRMELRRTIRLPAIRPKRR